jgi:hypothetical protein
MVGFVITTLEWEHTLRYRDIVCDVLWLHFLIIYATPHRLLFFPLAIACNITNISVQIHLSWSLLPASNICNLFHHRQHVHTYLSQQEYKSSSSMCTLNVDSIMSCINHYAYRSLYLS